MELCGGGNLSEVLEGDALLSWRQYFLPVAIGVARAMVYLHSNEPQIIHRDLKPDNVMLAGQDSSHAKVADFGLSRLATEDVTMTVAGTPIFSAPEVLMNERYGSAVDVWSFGCLLACMHTRAGPYPEVPCTEVRRCVIEGNLRPRAPASCPFGELIELCSRLSDERPSFAELLALLEGPSIQQLATQASFSRPRAEVEAGLVRERPTSDAQLSAVHDSQDRPDSHDSHRLFAPVIFENSFPTPGLLSVDPNQSIRSPASVPAVRFSRFSLRISSKRFSDQSERTSRPSQAAAPNELDQANESSGRTSDEDCRLTRPCSSPPARHVSVVL